MRPLFCASCGEVFGFISEDAAYERSICSDCKRQEDTDNAADMAGLTFNDRWSD